MLKVDAEDVGSMQGDNPEHMLRCAYKENDMLIALLLGMINSHLEKSLILLDACSYDALGRYETDMLILHMYRSALFQTKQGILKGVSTQVPKVIRAIASTEEHDAFTDTSIDNIRAWSKDIKAILLTEG